MSVPPPAPAGPADEGSGTSGRRPAGVRTRLVAWADRVPTGWFAGILTACFLGVTAAFGGLSAVAAPPLPELRAGDTHRNDQFSLTVERAVLIDELSDAGVYTEAGQRVLAVVLTAENEWDRALSASGGPSGRDGVIGSVRIDELGDMPADAVARLDDATNSPYLQPGVPAELVLAWAVDDNTLSDGDELHVTLRDMSLSTGQLVTYGQWWDSPVAAARLTVDVADVCAGADADDSADDGGDG
ncbi:hypothetical protein ABC304_01030 [Microbacterium sp. 1P10UB]|uniref:hypothetical protein n=1 Tax=unclassified Microbacterium TaxID=2609290 RepID=UPI00399F2923